MTTYRLTAALQPGRHALPRLVARLHALGVEVLSLHVEGDRVSASLRSPAHMGRVEAALGRSIDVRHVSLALERPVTTTYVVLRQESAA